MEVNLYLKTTDGHQLAVYTRGNKNKPVALVLHGGPGGNISESSFEPFNLNEWFVIAFDQRGCGQSLPFASLHHNTIANSVDDIELIRQHFQVKQWTLVGGSYGTTLALSYAIRYPHYVENLVLRGVFLGRDEDIHWLYQEGCSYFFPHEFQRFQAVIPENKRDDLIKSYYDIFMGNDESLKQQVAKAWADWEMSVVTLVPKEDRVNHQVTAADISLALLECHYFANHMHWDNDQYILDNTDVIEAIPTYIVHGRYDVDCRLSGAYQLQQKLKNATLTVAEASGHSGQEPKIKAILTDYLKQISTGGDN